MIINGLSRTHRRMGISLDLIETKGTPEEAGTAAARAAKVDSNDQGIWPTLFRLTPRKRTICLESAKRFVQAVCGEGVLADRERMAVAAREEKRRLHKFAYSLIASGSRPEVVRQAFVNAGFLRLGTLADSCETEMIIAGTQLVLANAHPIVVMRTMTAFMGFQVFDETGAWLKERNAGTVPESDELIIPGDLPEILLSSTLPASAVRQALHLAGPQLVAATLAGCPREIIDHIKTLDYSELGSMLLDWEISEARYRLSSDELADAQSAFAELLASTGDLESAAALEEEAWQMGVDESLVADISNLIMELDEKLLKTILSNMDPKLAAALIQAMEPIAHDRIFSSIGSSRGKKLLDALEAASPLSTPELTRKAQAFAQRVLSEIAPRGKVLGGTLQMSARLRQALTAILSRE